MLAELGQVYFMPREERSEKQNKLLENREFSFPYMAAGIGAYAAAYLKDDVLAERVWKALLETLGNKRGAAGGFTAVTLENQGNREVLKEIPGISTNFTAQFCLNVIMALEFIRRKLPEDK